jgi:preprotein translocase subunit SecG
MGFVIGLLTVVMVLDCLVLMLLVLIQLPKKEAGAGLAFGGTATDALFGAGSGNVLTKITKYAAGVFFVLAVALSLLQSNYYQRSHRAFQEAIEKAGGPASSGATPPGATPPAATPGKSASAPAETVPGTNLLTVAPAVEATNLPTAPSNPPAAPAGKQ